MKGRYPWLAASILLATFFVNVSIAKADSSEFAKFIHQSWSQSKDDKITPGMAGFLGIPAGTPIKYGEIDSDESGDGLDHEYQLVLSSRGTVDHVMFRVSEMVTPNEEESYYVRFSSSGVLEHAAVGHLPYKDGKIIRGAASAKVIDINSLEVKKRVPHELDFWLKGKYRKKKAKSK